MSKHHFTAEDREWELMMLQETDSYDPLRRFVYRVFVSRSKGRRRCKCHVGERRVRNGLVEVELFGDIYGKNEYHIERRFKADVLAVEVYELHEDWCRKRPEDWDGRKLIEDIKARCRRR
jgi:hypothetical protein